jgi:hypothetical protein
MLLTDYLDFKSKNVIHQQSNSTQVINIFVNFEEGGGQQNKMFLLKVQFSVRQEVFFNLRKPFLNKKKILKGSLFLFSVSVF